MTTNIIIKRTLCAFLSASGIFAALGRHRLQRRAFVLMYHRVVDPLDQQELHTQPGMYVTHSSFERQMLFLKKKYRILFLEELIDCIKRNENIGGCCAITFDDGWRDNYVHAFKILQKHHVPATVFLATAYVGTKRIFWPEELSHYIEEPLKGHNLLLNSSSPVFRFQREIEKHAGAEKAVFLNNAIEILKGYSPGERTTVLEYYRGMSTTRELPRQMLSWQEVEEMSMSGVVTFGAHTTEHEILDQLPLSKATRAISQSKDVIEHKTGSDVGMFAYPNGNYNEDILKTVRECGFIGAVTTKKGFLKQDTPLLEIPRIGIHEDISTTTPLFWGRILMERF